MQKSTIEPIQHLRGLAALGVVLFHSSTQVSGADGWHFTAGVAGIDLFFVISGFIMWVTAVNVDRQPRDFIVKRLIRIVPLYWLLTTVVLAIVVAAPALMRNAQFDPAHSLASYFFFAWPHPRFPERFWPILIPGWTLNYEMQFYLIVAMALFLKKSLRAWAIGGVLAACVIAGLIGEPASPFLFYTNPLILEFLYGTLVGVLYTHAPAMEVRSARITMVAAIGALLALDPFTNAGNRFITCGIPMTLLTLGAIHAPAFLPRKFFNLLGDASYSIYLTQFCVIAPSARFLRIPLQDAPGKSFLLGAALIIIATAIGIACYFAAERPLANVLRSRWKSIRSKPAAPTASFNSTAAAGSDRI